MKTRRRDDSRIPGRSLEQTPSLLLGVRVQPHRHSSWQELSSSGPCQLPADALPLRRPGASDAPSQQGPDVWSLSLSLSPAGLRKSLVMKHALLDTTFATQVFFEHCPRGTATLLLFPTSQTLKPPSLHCSLFCSFSPLRHLVPSHLKPPRVQVSPARCTQVKDKRGAYTLSLALGS